MRSAQPRRHGQLRGLEGTTRSLQFDGRFGRIFRALQPARYSEAALHALAEKMTAEKEDAGPTPETQPDNEENPGIAAGYTYLGQFIDHDLTFDPASSLDKQNDPDALTDYRTPRFDLDNVYGRGPDDQPYLYEADGLHMQLGEKLTGNPDDPEACDLPRHRSLKGDKFPGGEHARALIGDPRNDENVIVAQLQATMLRFHNRMVDTTGASLAEVQQAVRWHYQYVVLHDFLPTMVGQDMVHDILPHLASKKSILHDPPRLRFYKFRHEAFMPIEFSVAAYRFGHSMVRPIYRLNSTQGKPEEPFADSANGRIPIFDKAGDNKSLTGFKAIPAGFGIDWRLFFDMGNGAPQFGVKRVQPAYKIDTSLVNPLGALPPAVATGIISLAERNLLRGLRLGLPSGQAVARAMNAKVIPDDKLLVGKATEADTPGLKSIVEIDPAFKDSAPLWFYVLAEAQQMFKNDQTPIRLGPVGGRIVAETMIGLLLGDSHSFLSQDPAWTPVKQDFRMADLIAMAIRPL